MKNAIRLLKYAFPHWRPLVLMVLTMSISIVITLARPWPMKLMVDNVLGGQPLSTPFHRTFEALPGPATIDALLIWVCLSMVAIVLFGILIDMSKAMAPVVFGQQVSYDLGADLFLHLQKLSLLFHRRRPVATPLPGSLAMRLASNISWRAHCCLSSSRASKWS
jgi:ATP-binding cassette subfamily B protein/subfamily B ATP-binding cassette protein MsbA